MSRGLLALAVVAATATGASPAGAAEWLAGDLHVHTCFSHDAYCPEVDGPPDGEAHTLSLPVAGRFLEARTRGLDFLAITDHNDVRSASDPAFASLGVIGIPGYEASWRGHGQVLGATQVLDAADESPDAIRAVGERLRDEGGVLQANHPAYRATAPFTGCEEMGPDGPLDWGYGADVPVDTVEVWNPTSAMAPAERFLECLLDAGQTPAPTGGSDSHWAWLSPLQGAGNPTTWVLSDRRSRTGVLDALRAGRTAVSKLPPSHGGAPLVLERHARGDWRSAAGEEVRPRAKLRVRSLSPATGGLLRVRANGVTVLERVIAPGDAVVVRAPVSGWLRATLAALPGASAAGPGCEPAGRPASTCAYDHAMLAMSAVTRVQ